MNIWMTMILRWCREADGNDYYRGMINGWLIRDTTADAPRLAPWEHEYAENILRARRLGISA